LVLSNVQSAEGDFAIRLVRLDIESDEMTNLSGEAQVIDTSPAWSPDGSWIAFTRFEIGSPRASEGYQLWMMRPNGSQAHALTTDHDIQGTWLAWSPDGRYLLFQHQPLADPQIGPSVWVLEVETQSLWEAAAPGRWPSWLP
jgi:TolB protein